MIEKPLNFFTEICLFWQTKHVYVDLFSFTWDMEVKEKENKVLVRKKQIQALQSILREGEQIVDRLKKQEIYKEKYPVGFYIAPFVEGYPDLSISFKWNIRKRKTEGVTYLSFKEINTDFFDKSKEETIAFIFDCFNKENENILKMIEDYDIEKPGEYE